MLSPKENYLECIRFGRPEYVPMGNEPISWGFQFDGNFRMADWTDAWGVGWEMGLAGTVPFPKVNPLPTLDRLANLHRPAPGDLVYTDAMEQGLADARAKGLLVGGSLTYLLVERAWAIMGMEEFMVAFHTHPAEMHEYLHILAGYARGVFDRYLELGVDVIGFSEDLGTQRALMMSPDMFRRFVLPEYRYCFENVLRAGKIVNFHSCGCVQDVAGDLAAIGVTVLNPVQHRANDLRRVKQATLGRTALCGGIDTVVLAQGTPSDVRREVTAVMDALKPGGGYICAPDQSIPGIPEENTAALWAAAKEMGKY